MIKLKDILKELTGTWQNVDGNNIKKDTKDYICLMCNKTEFMKKTIIKYKNKYENYIWIDFGIYYIMNDNQ